ncbi:hypothetical protein ACFOX2_11560 [Corynebacterium marambiense]|uniref:hypothetical protein n=1 Tax=Corynebacterium marambiense TaxID=2765364 RepID=UPI002260BB00|nr:hypothetical protein [Corynebacterium marambiense]MCX7542238.1 hypothetical protein [Corynebacterium marambiense]
MAEPDDPVTGALLRRVGVVETLGLLDTDTNFQNWTWSMVRYGLTASPHRADWKGPDEGRGERDRHPDPG